MATPRIPRIAHFVVGLAADESPFHLAHYLAIASCRAIVQPEEVRVHCCGVPHGLYWASPPKGCGAAPVIGAVAALARGMLSLVGKPRVGLGSSGPAPT